MSASRGRVAVLFRAGLGLVYLAAFLSLAAQLADLIGPRGVLPWRDVADRLASLPGSPLARVLSIPTLFLWLDASRATITGVALLGAALAVVLAIGVAGRFTALALWLLYLSCITAGRDFFQYQWDNLLLETGFLAVFLPGRGSLVDLLRRRSLPEPSPAVIFLMRWVLFRLLFESGLAKIASGDGNWINLSAMTYYYETAPLPSLGGWLVHQLPLWFHRFSVFFTFLVELPMALFVFLPPARFRRSFFVVHAAFQASIAATSNYGFFNLLALVLSLLVLDDRDLEAAGARARHLLESVRLRQARRGVERARGAAGAAPAGSPDLPRVRGRAGPGAAAAWAGAALLVLISGIEALGYFDPEAVARPAIAAARSAWAPFRSVNVYHLFPGVVRDRLVTVFEGTTDGAAWTPYDVRRSPGEPAARPPTTCLHNPRFAFHWSFINPGRMRRDAEYLNNVAARLCCDPSAVAALFDPNPLLDPGNRPRALRLRQYHYRFGTWSDLARDGVYWRRQEAAPPSRAFACSCPSS